MSAGLSSRLGMYVAPVVVAILAVATLGLMGLYMVTSILKDVGLSGTVIWGSDAVVALLALAFGVKLGISAWRYEREAIDG